MSISGTIFPNNTLTGSIHNQANVNGDIGHINDKTYVYTQMSATTEWIINHNMGKYPVVAIINSAGDEVIGGNLHYDSLNKITITFDKAFAGKAYCN